MLGVILTATNKTSTNSRQIKNVTRITGDGNANLQGKKDKRIFLAQKTVSSR